MKMKKLQTVLQSSKLKSASVFFASLTFYSCLAFANGNGQSPSVVGATITPSKPVDFTITKSKKLAFTFQNVE